MPSSVPRRRAERPHSRLTRSLARVRGLGTGPTPALVAVLVLVLAGTGALVAALVPVGPGWLPGAGAVAVAAGCSWTLAARTGGRPQVVGTLALVMGIVVLAVDDARLRTRRRRADLRGVGGARRDGDGAGPALAARGP